MDVGVAHQGFGKLEHGQPVNGFRAVWSRVRFGVKQQPVVEVPHTLGEKPVFCILWMLLPNPQLRANLTTCPQAVPWKQDEWSDTMCKVWLAPETTGSYDGVEAVFLVGGE